MFGIGNQNSKKKENSRGVGNFSAEKFQHINIVPTYLSNSTANLLNRKFAKQFPTSLKIENFCFLVDRLKNTQVIESVSFSGGEPLLWDKLDEAIYYARKNKIKTILRSDGLKSPSKSLPDKVIINLHTYLDNPKLRKNIEATLDFYKKNLIPLSFVFYRRKNEREVNLALAENLAKKFKVRLSLAPSFFSEGLKCENCDYASIMIQPDGDSVILCRFLPHTAKLANYLSLREMYEKEFLPKLKKESKCLAQK